jgi:hypothetical protein
VLIIIIIIIIFWDVMTIFGLKMEDVTGEYYLLERNDNIWT